METARALPAGWRDWLELARPFSLIASLVPVAVGSAVAWSLGRGDLAALPLVLLGAIALQAGTNAINEVFDVARGVDTLHTPHASRVLVEGRLNARAAYRAGLALLAAGPATGVVLSLVFHLGTAPFLLGLAGACAGYAYTGPPFALKSHALGAPVVGLVMGPIMVLGAEYVQAAAVTWSALVASVPVGLLVAGVCFANDLRDARSDRAAGVVTAANVLGARRGWQVYVAVLAAAYAAVPVAVAAGALRWPALVALASAPGALGLVTRRAATREAAAGDLAELDKHTAQMHLLFGLLLAAGVAVAGVVA